MRYVPYYSRFDVKIVKSTKKVNKLLPGFTKEDERNEILTFVCFIGRKNKTPQ